MKIGIGIPIPERINLPGQSGGAPLPFEYTAIDNSFSMEFDGTASYFDLGADSSLDIFGGDFSVSLWFKHTNTSGSANPFLEIAAFSDKMAVTLGFTSNTGVGFAVGSTWNYNAGSGFNDGNWHHLAATRTGTTYKIYVDGVDTPFSSGSWGYNTTQSPYNRIGSGGFGVKFYNGYMDEVAFFSSKISEETIQAIYDATANNPGKVADLSETPEGVPTAWYRMGD